MRGARSISQAPRKKTVFSAASGAFTQSSKPLLRAQWSLQGEQQTSGPRPDRPRIVITKSIRYPGEGGWVQTRAPGECRDALTK